MFKQRAVALRCYAKILAAQPDDAATISRVACLHAEARDHVAAIRGFENALLLRPDDTDGWFNLGFLRQQQHDHDGAIAAFERALAINRQHDLSWYGLALSLMAQGCHQDAVAPLENNIELQPMSPHGHMELARVHFKLGDLAQCERQMRLLKSFDPKSTAQLEDETGISVGIERWWIR